MGQTKEERREYMQNYYKIHPEKRDKWRKRDLQYYYNHIEKQKARHRLYYQTHREELRIKQKIYFKNRYNKKFPNIRKKKKPLGNIYWNPDGTPKL